jgi:hypothetical protein
MFKYFGLFTLDFSHETNALKMKRLNLIGSGFLESKWPKLALLKI